VQKLPARRIERRLTAAAHWFAEQLSRHWAGRCDLVFTSEALNLADLHRLVPALEKKSSVVYFHGNQLPNPDATTESPLDLVNLNTAAAATEIWFNSLYHLRTFLAKASSLVRRHPELSARNPMPELTAKAQLMHPPIDFSVLHELAKQRIRRDKRIVFLQAGIFMSVKVGAVADHHCVRALAAGCFPMLPNVGVYRELLPEKLHPPCLYNGQPDQLAGRMQDLWHLERPTGYEEQLKDMLRVFDPHIACSAIDQRLEDLVTSRLMAAEISGKPAAPTKH
jgi:hypothetical protein